jgi:hypothetical protein
MKVLKQLNLRRASIGRGRMELWGRAAACFITTCVLTAQGFARNPLVQRQLLPDLNVGQVYTRDFGALVSIVNAGARASSPCEVTLFVYDTKGALLWQQSHPLKALPVGTSEQVLFNAGGRGWAGRRFQVMVDSGNAVRELDESNNRTSLMNAPAGTGDEPEHKPASGSATVDLAAINVFPATADNHEVVRGVIRNLGRETYTGKRQATITLLIQKDGADFRRTLGTTKVPVIAAGSQQFITFPRPPEFDNSDAYRLTLTISGGDADASNDTKVNSSPGFSAGGGSPSADLEAVQVERFREGGADKMRGIIRNNSTQRYGGEREARLYFIDRTGGQKKSILIAAEIIRDIDGGGRREIVGDFPAGLRKVKTYTLKLSISGGDDHSANDEKLKEFVALDN